MSRDVGDFSSSSYYDVYLQNMATLSNIKVHRAKRYHNMMHKLYNDAWYVASCTLSSVLISFDSANLAATTPSYGTAKSFLNTQDMPDE